MPNLIRYIAQEDPEQEKLRGMEITLYKGKFLQHRQLKTILTGINGPLMNCAK